MESTRQNKTPEYTLRAIRNYLDKKKAEDPEEYNRKHREHMKAYRERQKLKKLQEQNNAI